MDSRTVTKQRLLHRTRCLAACGRVNRTVLSLLALGVGVGLMIGLAERPSPQSSAASSGGPKQTAAQAKPTPTSASRKTSADDPAVQEFLADPAGYPHHLMDALLEMEKREGRQNALVYYVVADRLMPKVPEGQQNDLIKQVLAQGWSESANALLPHLAGFQPMLKEIRKGVGLDYARNVGCEQGPYTPIPNFLAGQISGKMLCVEGQYFKSQGKYVEALDNFLAALTMGRDYGAPGGLRISSLVSIAMQFIALNQIRDLIVSGNLDRATLGRLLERLKVIEKTEGSPVDGYRGEASCRKWYFHLMRENPDEARRILKAGLPDGVFSVDDLIANVDHVEAEGDRMWDLVIEYAGQPYWQRNNGHLRMGLEMAKVRLHPFLKDCVQNLFETDGRFFVMKARLLETQIGAALAADRLDKGAYPVHAADLVPGYFEALPIDPFSGRELVFRTSPDRTSYTLYSIGPDQRDDGGTVRYDLREGMSGRGDIVFP